MYQVEHTDTFEGQANYCWVRRYEISPRGNGTHKGERLSLVRQAKALCGLSGVRADTTDYGDMVEIRPRGVCQIIFVTWIDRPDPLPTE
jgi:hypothetical protein